jgi:indole-3-glycerol phosphate synthase
MNILDEILQHTRTVVEQRKRQISTDELKQRPAFHAPTLSMADHLSGDRLAIIGEIKKASPSKGTIRGEFDVREIARQYKHGTAAAISVLTEPDYFAGSLENLSMVRRTVDLPLLRKDFIVDPYQLVEARAYGADAVLLIASALDPDELYDLQAHAQELDLSCLVEAYSEEDLEKIDFDHVDLLGINNRDLQTFAVDIDHSLEMFRQVPEHIIRISESGLKSPEDLAHVRRGGIDAVLIGETLMRAHDPGAKLAELSAAVAGLLEQKHEPLKKVG